MNRYNCLKKILIPPHKFIKYNCSDEYKMEIEIDSCLEEEIKDLWNKGIRTTGCCCGHGAILGYISVVTDDIPKMLELGYQNYIFNDELGGIDRKDTFIPKSTHHYYFNLIDHF